MTAAAGSFSIVRRVQFPETDMAGVVDDMREELDSTDFAATQLGRE